MILLIVPLTSLVANVIQLLLSLSIIVIIHEAGHFWAAKWFGCRVEKFYLFFNPGFSIWKKKIGPTEFSIGWLPLGGYVKIAGMETDRSANETHLKVSETWEYRSKPAWQRLIIILAGVTCNVVLAFIIFAATLYSYPIQQLPMKNLRYGLHTDSLTSAMGIKKGDLVTAVNGKTLVYFNELPAALASVNGTSISITKNGRDTVLKLPAGYNFRVMQKTAVLQPRIPPVVSQTAPPVSCLSGSIQHGDQLLSCNGIPTPFLQDFLKASAACSALQQFTITLLRKHDTLAATLLPSGLSALGLAFSAPMEVLGHQEIKLTVPQSFMASASMIISTTQTYFYFLWMLFTSDQVKVQDTLGSVIGMGKSFQGKWDVRRFWLITALISLILALGNVLPIPGLDGGYALFAIFEWISGRVPPIRIIRAAQIVGAVLLLVISCYAFGLDIYRMFR